MNLLTHRHLLVLFSGVENNNEPKGSLLSIGFFPRVQKMMMSRDFDCHHPLLFWLNCRRQQQAS
jgi:hypothetical protein